MSVKMHIGDVQSIGPLGVWPIRAEGLSHAHFKVPPFTDDLKFSETQGQVGPSVSRIEVENMSDEDFLIPAGWLVGSELLQVRSFNNAELIPAGSSVLADVSCVEQGRWSHGANRVDAGRAPLSVIVAGSEFDNQSSSWRLSQERRQSKVWAQVSKHESRSGPRPTNSLEQIMREDSQNVPHVRRILSEVDKSLQTLELQNGAVISLEGEPLLLELYSESKGLRHILSQTLSSLAFDVQQFESRPMPSQKVKSFLEQLGLASLDVLRQNDWVTQKTGGSQSIETRSTEDKKGGIIQLTAINRSHRILLEV